MRGRFLHAICPVMHFARSKWLGWTINGTEVVGGWTVYHLIKPRGQS